MSERADFEALFRAEYPALVRELRLILSDRSGAEEAAAEAFVACWQRWPEVSRYDRPGAWVRKVALRQARRARWRRGRRDQVERSHRGPTVDDPLDLDLLDALADLSDAQRVAVVLHHLGGWPAADIAAVLDCAEATVRSHLARGRQRLAERLADRPEPTAAPVEVPDARPR